MTHDLWQILIYSIAVVVGIFAFSFACLVALVIWAYRKEKQEKTEEIRRSEMPGVESFGVNPAVGRKLY